MKRGHLENSTPPLISVVITTKNEIKNIDNCLDSLKQQVYPQNKIEIIVVDNNSTDATKQIAKKYTPHVFNYGPERSAQRNYGALKSTGEYYLYLDADMILDKQVIQDCVNKITNNPKIIALYIPEIIMGTSFLCQVRRFERTFYNGTMIDCVRFVAMEYFQKVHGFDETMSGPEDWDFDKKIRNAGKVDIINSPVYHNETDFNLKSYLRKKSYYAKSFKKYISKWGKDDPDISKQFGVKYRYFDVFINNNKWIKLIQFPHLTIGMYFLKFLLGLKYITIKMQNNA